MTSIAATQQSLYATIVAATSAANKARSGNTLPGSGNASETSAANSTKVSLSQSMSLADVARKYDVQNMSPRDMVNMADELQKAGAISGEDALTLKFQPALNPNNNTGGGPGWATGADTPTNFLAEWKSRLEFDKSIGNTANFGFEQKAINLIGNLAALRESSTAQTSSASASATTTHDYTNMTPNQMRDVAQELYKSGKVDLTQLLMLQTAGVPIGKQGANGEFIPLSESEKASYSSKPMNYVQVSKDAIQFLEQTGHASDPKSGAEQWKGILATLQGMTPNNAV